MARTVAAPESAAAPLLGDARVARPPLLTNLEHVRFAAALAILVHHALLYADALHRSAVPGVVGLSLSASLAGVDVFFVISGFIMWLVTRQAGERPSPRAFLKRRLARVFCGYWPYLLLILILLACFDRPLPRPATLVENVLLLPVAGDRRVLGVTWSLTLELFFYAVFAALLWLRPRARLCGLVAIAVTTAFAYGVVAPGRSATIVPGSAATDAWLDVVLSPYLLEFGAGSVVCVVVHAARRPPAPGLALALAVVLFACGAWYDHVQLGGAMRSGAHALERVLLFGPAAAALVYGVVGLERHGVAPRPQLGRLLGGASYSLYLAHTIFLSLFGWLGLGRLHGAALAVAGGSWIAAILGYAVWHHRFVERPLYEAALRRLGLSAHDGRATATERARVVRSASS